MKVEWKTAYYENANKAAAKGLARLAAASNDEMWHNKNLSYCIKIVLGYWRLK